MSLQLTRNGRFSHLAFFVLTIVLGMQAKRMFIALLLYVLRDNLGRSANLAGLLAFLVFATSFLIGIMRQQFGLSRMWRYPALMLGPLLILTNLFFNLITADSSAVIALFPLFLTMLAVAAFLQFLPHYLLHHRDNLPLFVFGLLLGLATDTALHGAVLTYDFVWHNLLGLLLIFAVQLAFLLLNSQRDGDGRSLSVRWPWGLMVIGPYLFLQMLLFQNVARLTAVTSWHFPWAFAWIITGHMVGLVTAVTLLKRQTNLIDWLAFTLLLILSTIGQPAGWLAAAQHLAGQIGSAALLTLILLRLGTQSNGPQGSRSLTLAYGFGFVLNVLFSFAYYIAYDTLVPFSNTALPTILATLIGLLALLGLRHKAATQTAPTFRLGLAFVLLLLPLYALLTQQTAVATPGNGYPLRIMTYNLHNGFHPYGYMDLEALAQVIESENPDIIALQEVSRGWIINGSTDMLAWLSHRLNMPYIFNPTADSIWGNALLSRYPITNYQLLPLPPDDLPLKRGFISAEIAVGSGRNLHVIATHLYHPDSGSAIRQQQIQLILDTVQNQRHTIIMGDFNAQPDTPEIALLHNAGYTDILAEVQPNATFPALIPNIQIDYIWLTPDLTADLITIPTTPASDHLPIAATIHP